jgi:hypothetical protein
MAPYDSDSSDNDEFEETNVLLGYVDDEPPEGQDLTTHLGGQPVELHDLGSAHSSSDPGLGMA